MRPASEAAHRQPSIALASVGAAGLQDRSPEAKDGGRTGAMTERNRIYPDIPDILMHSWIN
jgi:hypothetical protein